jgi:hypothetical protein
MANFKFYNDWGGGTYLELHDNHTLWKIDRAFNFDDYEYEVSRAIFAMENRYKDLEVFQFGRSGRHICVPDTPTNRRRYKALVQYAEQLEQMIINHFNNEETEL